MSGTAGEGDAAALRKENEVLRREVANLKSMLEEEKTRRHDGGLDTHKVHEGRATASIIEEKESDAEVVQLYNELIVERKKCAVLAEMLEDVRSHFFEIKKLYSEMERIEQRNKTEDGAAAQ